MSTDPKDIAASLTRQYALRRFHKHYLEMETPAGSQFNQLVGIGNRVDPTTGEVHPWTDFVPDFFRQVERSFRDYPIHQQFGITIAEAMAMPVNRWYRIRASAKHIKDNQPPPRDTEGQMLEILKAFLEVRSDDS